jgi:hypothetical protein
MGPVGTGPSRLAAGPGRWAHRALAPLMRLAPRSPLTDLRMLGLDGAVPGLPPAPYELPPAGAVRRCGRTDEVRDDLGDLDVGAGARLLRHLPPLAHRGNPATLVAPARLAAVVRRRHRCAGGRLPVGVLRGEPEVLLEDQKKGVALPALIQHEREGAVLARDNARPARSASRAGRHESPGGTMSGRSDATPAVAVGSTAGDASVERQLPAQGASAGGCGPS